MQTRRLVMIYMAVALSRDARAAEVCGNGLDDDSDGMADEQCFPTLTSGQCESPLSCADTGAVSPSTGSLHYSLDPDISPRVPFGPGIGFRRFYLSQYAPGGGAPAYRTSLGPRWGHTYATWIDALTSPTRVILHTTQGQDVLPRVSTSLRQRSREITEQRPPSLRSDLDPIRSDPRSSSAVG